jgi:hypothetical protein
MTSINAIKIGKFIGIVLDVENGEIPVIICNHHLRIRVAIDTTQPLVPGFKLPHQGCSYIWIKFLYERLPDYCSLCGVIGHRKTFCFAPLPPRPQDRYGFSLRGYVYPGTRVSPSSQSEQQAVSTVVIVSPSLLCTADLGVVICLSGSIEHRAIGPSSRPMQVSLEEDKLLKIARGRKLAAKAMDTVQLPHVQRKNLYLLLHGSGLATSPPLPQLDTCDKGKNKISDVPLSLGYYHDPLSLGSIIDPTWVFGTRSFAGPLPIVHAPHIQPPSASPTQVSPHILTHTPISSPSPLHSPFEFLNYPQTLFPASPQTYPIVFLPPPSFQLAPGLPTYYSPPIYPSSLFPL